MKKARVRTLKKSVWICGAIILVVVVLSGVIYLRNGKVNMDLVKSAEACFQYGDTDAKSQLSDKELEAVKAIFNGKKLHKDTPNCCFSEAACIKFDDGRTFCIAQDTCPIVCWKEKNKYIELTENEKNQLYKLLEPYGFTFPCL